jgi:hypothetical protein
MYFNFYFEILLADPHPIEIPQLIMLIRQDRAVFQGKQAFFL